MEGNQHAPRPAVARRWPALRWLCTLPLPAPGRLQGRSVHGTGAGARHLYLDLGSCPTHPLPQAVWVQDRLHKADLDCHLWLLRTQPSGRAPSPLICDTQLRAAPASGGALLNVMLTSRFLSTTWGQWSQPAQALRTPLPAPLPWLHGTGHSPPRPAGAEPHRQGGSC